jgi:hypothetical protein
MYSFCLCVFNHRNQQERELRHKIKKGELTDIPSDVLSNLSASFLNTSKGTNNIDIKDTSKTH